MQPRGHWINGAILGALGCAAAGSALAGGTTIRVSVGTGGVQANASSGDVAISGDGRLLTYNSYAPNLVAGDINDRMDVFAHNLTSGTTGILSIGRGAQPANSYSFAPSISPGGRFIAFESWASNLVSGDNRNSRDVFVRDR